MVCHSINFPVLPLSSQIHRGWGFLKKPNLYLFPHMHISFHGDVVSTPDQILSNKIIIHWNDRQGNNIKYEKWCHWVNFGMQPIWMRVRSTADKGFISLFVMERVQIWKYCFRDGKQHGYNPDYSSSHTNLHQCMGCLDLHRPYYSFIPKKTTTKKGNSLLTSTFNHSIPAFPFHSEIKTQTKSFFTQD